MDALTLLSGDARTFVDEVWATRPHLHRASPRDLVALLGLDDVDHLLTDTALRTPALRLAQDGRVLASSRYTRSATLAGAPLTGLVDPRKVLDLVAAGATVVLQGLHRYWPPLTHLARDLEAALGHPCQVNAYLTPRGSQGFARHSDTHDVFVLQTHGRKRWQLYDGDGAPREVLLSPGTSMYLPTGTPHAARTEESASLHVTVGINQITWRHVLGRVSEQLLSADGLDQAVPAGYPTDPRALSEGLTRRLAALAAATAAVDPAEVAWQETRRFLTSRPPVLRGALGDRLALADIADDTMLRRRRGSVCELRPDGERLRVLLGDRELCVPAWLVDAVRHVRDHPELRPADLADWLDPQSRLVLARRLVREGLLEVPARPT